MSIVSNKEVSRQQQSYLPFIQTVKLLSIVSFSSKSNPADVGLVILPTEKPYCNNKHARAHGQAKTNKQTTTHAETIGTCSTLSTCYRPLAGCVL